MQHSSEQLKIDCGQEKKIQEIYEKDECGNCGQPFESINGCQACASNRQKRAFLASQKNKKDAR